MSVFVLTERGREREESKTAGSGGGRKISPKYWWRELKCDGRCKQPILYKVLSRNTSRGQK